MTASHVTRLYQAVINDVINGVREHFIDDGLDENCLIELKQTWEKKLIESKAIDSLVPESSFLVRSSVAPGLVHQSGNLSQFTVQSAGNNLVQPTLVQYGNGEGGTKTVTLLPNKGVTIAALPQGLSQGNLLSGAASAATLALPPDMASQWLQSVQRDGHTVQFQPITSNQVAAGGSKQITLTSQPPGSQMAISQSNKNFTLLKLPSTTSHQQPSSKQPAYTIVKMSAPPNSQQIQQSPSNMLTLIRKPTAMSSGGNQTGTTTSPNVTVLKVPAQQVVHHAQPLNNSIPMHLAPARQVSLNQLNQQAAGHSGPGFQPSLLQPRGPIVVPASAHQMANSQFTLANSQAIAAAQQVPGTFSVDGHRDTSDEDEEDDYNDDDDKDADDEEQGDEDMDGGGEEEDPLNSNDDVSEEEGDSQDIFDIDNVVVCQYDKISRSRNKWKFQFKDGIMNLEGKDYVFQKAIGDAEW